MCAGPRLCGPTGREAYCRGAEDVPGCSVISWGASPALSNKGTWSRGSGCSSSLAWCLSAATCPIQPLPGARPKQPCQETGCLQRVLLTPAPGLVGACPGGLLESPLPLHTWWSPRGLEASKRRLRGGGGCLAQDTAAAPPFQEASRESASHSSCSWQGSVPFIRPEKMALAQDPGPAPPPPHWLACSEMGPFLLFCYRVFHCDRGAEAASGATSNWLDSNSQEGGSQNGQGAGGGGRRG